MADPLSISISTLNVISFASQSCQFLFEFFHNAAEAPKDIQQRLSTLQALSSTFEGIRALGEDMPTEVQWSAEFDTRLRDCLADFRDMEIKMQTMSKEIEKGRARRTWARLKWLSNDQSFNKFFTRVQTYQAMFALELLILQIRMSISPSSLILPSDGTERSFPTRESSHIGPEAQTENEAVVSPRVEPLQLSESNTKPLMSHLQFCLALDQVCKCLTDTPECPMHPNKSRSLCQPESSSNELVSIHSSILGDVSKRKFGPDHGRNVDPSVSDSAPCFVSFLKHHAEPVSIRSSAVHQYEVFSGKALLWLGPVLLQRWNLEYEKPVFHVTRPDQGYGIALTVALSFGKANFFIYWVRKHWRPQSLSLSLRWKLSFARPVRNDAETIQLARKGDIRGMQRILQQGEGRVSDATVNGTTLLHIAARTNHVQMVNFLIREGADVNAHDEDGETPLHIAVSRAEDYNISRVLIENGADLENRSIDGRTPLHTFFNKVVKKILLYHGDEINEASADSQGMTLLHFVAWSSKSDSEIFKRCMERTGGATSIWLNDNERRSILHFAAQRGNAAILQCVLSLCQQLDVTHKDQSGRTTLHYAVESKRSAVIDIICAHGGAIRGTDDRGRTVLHHAALRGNLEAVEKLIELGAANDMYSEDKDGKTPTQLASQRGATTVVEYLTELQSRIVRKNTAKNDPSMDSSIHEGLGPRGSWRLRGRFVPKRKFSGVSVNFAFTLLAATLLWHCVRIFIWAPIR